jgi:predicted DNA-binding transcriptional regulator YafY
LTARAIADELEVSERTVYRDVQALVHSGVPIVGEAGVGYALGAGFDLPPIMFDADELEALALGLRVVRAWGDSALAHGATRAIAKVEAILPNDLRERVRQSAVFAPQHHVASERFADNLAQLRAAIRAKSRVRFGYLDAKEQETQRTARPLALAFWGASWTLGAWCELREDFRTFAVTRMTTLTALDAFRPEPGRTLEDFLERVAGKDHRGILGR